MSDCSSPKPELSDQDYLDLDYYKCATDFKYWFRHQGWIHDKRAGITHGPGLNLWPGQIPFVDMLLALLWVITGKARQLGISWICANFEVWDMLFHDNVAQAIIDKDNDGAMIHLDRARFIYEKQPAHLRRAVPVVDNKHELRLSNGSSLIALPCTARKARGLTVKRIRCEEMAFWTNAYALWPAIIGAVADGGQVIIASTSAGLGGLYSDIWHNLGRFVKFFLGWRAHPERDDTWYAETLSGLKDANKMRREYPDVEEDMFAGSFGKYFDGDKLHLYNAEGVKLEPGQENEPLPGYPDGWHVYRLPEQGKQYVIGADPADVGPDACAADIVDVETGLQVGHLWSGIEPDGSNRIGWRWDDFTDHVVEAARMYNGALIVWERNNHGHACIGRTEAVHGYLNMYRQEPTDREKRSGKTVGEYGWLETSSSRPALLGMHKSAVTGEEYLPMHSATVMEHRTFVFTTSRRAEAEEGAHDDRVFAGALATRGRQYALDHTPDFWSVTV